MTKKKVAAWQSWLTFKSNSLVMKSITASNEGKFSTSTALFQATGYDILLA